MLIPNADRAVVDLAKLTDYCLSLDHPRGRHKARVFASALGMTEEHATLLQQALFEAIQTQPATAAEWDVFGQRFTIDFSLAGPEGVATIRSSWIVRTGEDFPRLASCYVM